MSKKSAKKMKAAKSSAQKDQTQGGEIETVAPGDELKYVGRTGTVFIIDDVGQIRAALQAGKRSATKHDKKMVPDLKKGETIYDVRIPVLMTTAQGTVLAEAKLPVSKSRVYASYEEAKNQLMAESPHVPAYPSQQFAHSHRLN